MCQRKKKMGPKPKCTWRFTEKLSAEIFVRWDKRWLTVIIYSLCALLPISHMTIRCTINKKFMKVSKWISWLSTYEGERVPILKLEITPNPNFYYTDPCHGSQMCSVSRVSWEVKKHLYLCWGYKMTNDQFSLFSCSFSALLITTTECMGYFGFSLIICTVRNAAV